MGIEANCVLDEILELKRESTTLFVNTGAAEIEEFDNIFSLIDVARTSLVGDEPYFTCIHRTRTGTGSLTHSRIDTEHMCLTSILYCVTATRFLRTKREKKTLDSTKE